MTHRLIGLCYCVYPHTLYTVQYKYRLVQYTCDVMQCSSTRVWKLVHYKPVDLHINHASRIMKENLATEWLMHSKYSMYSSYCNQLSAVLSPHRQTRNGFRSDCKSSAKAEAAQVSVRGWSICKPCGIERKILQLSQSNPFSIQEYTQWDRERKKKNIGPNPD